MHVVNVQASRANGGVAISRRTGNQQMFSFFCTLLFVGAVSLLLALWRAHPHAIAGIVLLSGVCVWLCVMCDRAASTFAPLS